MVVLDRLKQFIRQHDLLQTGHRVLLAVSGGRDSMLMARLFHELGQNSIIAHCNFKLREEDADKDEQLVRRMAGEWGMPVFVKHFDTVGYAQREKISIQMAARELRYTWFETLRAEQGCEKIAIAQHGNDHVETVLLNLTRGTGIRGLLGIQIQRDRIIRPLLFLSAEEVTAEVERLGVPYRDDLSNFSIQYARNKIRHDIIPHLKEIQSDFELIMQENIQRFAESYAFIKRTVDALRGSLFRLNGDQVLIRKEGLAPLLSDGFLVYELFKPYGFNRTATDDLIQAFNGHSGVLLASPNYEMLLDRETIVLRRVNMEISVPSLLVDRFSQAIWGRWVFQVMEGEDGARGDRKDRFSERIDADKLVFPLELRGWRQGDRFVPLGMNGHKKISDFFIQQKINRFEKERVPLLINGDGEIIWVVGWRLDNRYKVTENTKKVLTFVCKQEQ